MRSLFSRFRQPKKPKTNTETAEQWDEQRAKIEAALRANGAKPMTKADHDTPQNTLLVVPSVGLRAFLQRYIYKNKKPDVLAFHGGASYREKTHTIRTKDDTGEYQVFTVDPKTGAMTPLPMKDGALTGRANRKSLDPQGDSHFYKKVD